MRLTTSELQKKQSQTTAMLDEKGDVLTRTLVLEGLTPELEVYLGMELEN
jgi:hypothetical protein